MYLLKHAKPWVDVYLHLYTHTHAYIYIYIYVYACLHICMCIYMRTHVYNCIWPSICCVRVRHLLGRQAIAVCFWLSFFWGLSAVKISLMAVSRCNLAGARTPLPGSRWTASARSCTTRTSTASAAPSLSDFGSWMARSSTS